MHKYINTYVVYASPNTSKDAKIGEEKVNKLPFLLPTQGYKPSLSSCEHKDINKFVFLFFH